MDILEIAILTDDLAATETFYCKILGLRLAGMEEHSVSLIAGKSILHFVKSDKLNPVYHFAFNIPQNKLEEAVTWASAKFELIKNADYEVVTHFDSWNAKAIYFFDNNGNILEFIARFDLDNSSDKPFDASSIQSISEIGIVTDSPLKLADELIRENGLNFFKKGPKSEKFVALGDDHGLLIIVEKGRNWYPTMQPARKHYTKVEMMVEGMIKELLMQDDRHEEM